jgi:ribonuclease E
MATKRMLIDASHPEEVRVVSLNGNRIEEFDYVSAAKQQLKGNIYLAKVTRVEPSLQAAFVDYGGNRHGFLAFNEIHPDYYQIPVADREALLAEQARLARKSEEAEDEEDEAAADTTADADAPESGDGDEVDAADAAATTEDDAVDAGEDEDEDDAEPDGAAIPVEELGGDTVDEETEEAAVPLARRYKIQEVVKKRQVMLVQVVKEERGNKGAALTTYLSLAGRYCVLMPNTARGGGISRKIANPAERKKLRRTLKELDIPQGMGVIVRTAGLKRTKAEIRRDYEYLVQTWDKVRKLTLESTAPALVYEEANIIKRAIRDGYSKDVDEILVDGEDGYKVAKEFMKAMTPSHAKKVQLYKDNIPLFHRYQVEQQLEALNDFTVQLKSGAYIIINPTEALVTIDVNSGRSTKERNIEETALRTNLEAADEIARQLRLRELSGLLVIDFIDMEEAKHRQQVERKLKEALRHDRARIQLGRISPFGLLEMSRQRLRPSLLEINTVPMPHAGGIGYRRSVESSALTALRAIEEEAIRQRSAAISIFVPAEVAIYILNAKREHLIEIENRYGISVQVDRDDKLAVPEYRVERVKASRDAADQNAAPVVAGAVQIDALEEDEEESVAVEAEEKTEEKGGRSRGRKRGRRRKSAETESGEEAQAEDSEASGEEAEAQAGDEEEQPRRGRRRRGRRGGRRRSRRNREADADNEGDNEGDSEGVDAAAAGTEAQSESEAGTEAEAAVAEAAEPAPAGENDAAPTPDAEPEEPGGSETPPPAAGPAAEERPAAPATASAEAEPQSERGGNGAHAAEAEAEETDSDDGQQPVVVDVSQAEPKERRRGWWQKSG